MPECAPDSLPYADVLGVRIHAIDMETAVLRSQELLARGGKGYICVTGVHGVMEAQGDPKLREILNASFLCIPDGVPTVWVGHWQGQPQMRRVYGPDFMLEMCRRSLRNDYRHFLYGGGPGVAKLLRARLTRNMPWLHVVGTYTPPFGPLSAEEERKLEESVAEARPDVMWVGLSTPKQERFMAEHCERLAVKLMVGVGAAFDFHAGLRADAPRWMKQSGLQWLHRLLQEPRRLGPRYLKNNPRFVWEILRKTMERASTGA